MKNVTSFAVRRLVLWAILVILPAMIVQATPLWSSLTITLQNTGNVYEDGLYIYTGTGGGRGAYTHTPGYWWGTAFIQWEGDSVGWVLENGVGGKSKFFGFDELPHSVGDTIVTVTSQEGNVSGNPSGDDAATAEPVNVISGGMFFDEPDLWLAGSGFGLEWTRTYNSALTTTNALGFRWSHNYDWSLTATTNLYVNGAFSNAIPALCLTMGGGETRILLQRDSDSWSSVHAPPLTITRTTSNEYFLPLPSGYSCLFGTNGLIKSMSNAWNNALAFSYTNAGGSVSLEKVTHSDGRALVFSYSSNRLVRVDTPSTNLCYLYSYNAIGELTNAIARLPSGDSLTSYSYDTNGVHALASHVNPLGEVAAYAYLTNAQGLLTPTCGKVDVATNYYEHTLSYNGATTTVTYTREGTNAVYRYSFDPLSRLILRIDLPGNTNEVKLMSYDSYTQVKTAEQQGTPTNIVKSDKRLVDYSGRLLTYFPAYTSTSSPSWTFSWNTNWDMLASSADPEGHRDEWDYANGKVSRARSFPATNMTVETIYSYTTNGLLAAVTNANGHWVKYQYNEYGYPTQTFSQVGLTNWMTWDTLGHLKEIRLPSAERTTNEPPEMVPRVIAYDPDELGRVRKITWPDDSFETYSFDAIGNVTNHVDVAGRTSSFAWLPTRKLASTTRMLGAQAVTVGLDYNQQMSMVTVRDELGRAVETYQLDLQARPIRVTNVENQVMTIAWGLADFVQSIVRFDGTTNSLTYDEGGRVQQVTYPGQTVAYRYFKNGLPMTTSNQWGVVSNAFDGANRVTFQSSPGPNSTVNYTLYPAGQVSNVVTVAGTNTYILDAAERLTTLTAARSGLAVESFQYGYNPLNGAVSGVTYPNGITCSMDYDKLDRPTAMIWKNASNEVLRSRAYSYNAAGMITNIACETGEQIVYTFDSLDRLTGEQHVNIAGQTTSQETYGFDLAGNRTNKTVWSGTTPLATVNYTLGTGNRLASWSVAETDLVGRVDVAGVSSEAIGTNDRFGWLYVSNLTSGASIKPYIFGTNFWAYDLTVGLGTQKVVAAIRDQAGNTTRVTNEVFLTVVTNGAYQYNTAGCVTDITYRGKDYSSAIDLTWDAQYQLTAVTTNGADAERQGYDALGRRLWTWDASGGTNWMVYDGPHVVADVNASGDIVRSYVWGPGIDNLLTVTVYGETTNTYYALKDHLKSVLALVNEAGQIVEKYRYDAWGRTTVFDASGNPLSASAVGNRYCWQSREYSFKTGLYYFRARWYTPCEGRWLSNDPLGIAGGMNQYVFCANNPANFRDPFGLCKTEPNIFGIGSLPPGLLPYVQPSSPWLNVPASMANTVPFAGNALLCAFAGAVNTFGIDWSSPSAPSEAMLMLIMPAASGFRVFARGGQAWHFGLETAGNLNIVHIGRHVRHGVHAAFGAVAPYYADIHVYIQRAIPFVRMWRP